MYIVEADPAFENDFAFELVGSDEEIRNIKEGFVCALLGMAAVDQNTRFEYHPVMKLAFSERTTIRQHERDEFVAFLDAHEAALLDRGRIAAAKALAGQLTTAQFMQEQQLIKTYTDPDVFTILRHDGVQYISSKVQGTNRLSVSGDEPNGMSSNMRTTAQLTGSNWGGFLYPIQRDEQGVVTSVSDQYQYTIGNLSEEGEYTAIASVLDYHVVYTLREAQLARADLSDIT